ncbi:MAG: LysM peptidoglycan-binding domain-containing protein, partial [Alphaproteobacteria bacterium]|nr:LysM peptidoglycan-binding domain-containing protein [Alphaproteobacteria bacterium]
LSGKGMPGVQISLQSDGRTLGQTTVDPTGHWTVDLVQVLDTRDHQIISEARWPGSQHVVRGQDVRIALPQTIVTHTIVHDVKLSEGRDARRQSLQQRNRASNDWRVAQANRGDREDDRRDSADPFEREGTRSVTASPIFDWLRRSSEAYDQVIVNDLSGGDVTFPLALPSGQAGRLAQRERRSAAPFEDDIRDNRRVPGFVRRLQDRLADFNTGVWEWLAQARQSYRTGIVEQLTQGDRVSRDRYVRGAQNGETDGWPTERDPSTLDNQRRRTGQGQDEQQDRAKRRADSEANIELPPPALPDPENEALIRRAEQDAQRARELARQAAEQAERTRKETEQLLAEEKRLAEEAAARAAAAEKDLQSKREAVSRNAAETEARRRADEQRRAEEKEGAKKAEAEERARAEALRRQAEEMAAAASQQADQEFAAGRVQQRPTDLPPETDVETGWPSTTAPNVATAKDASRRRLSYKDSATDPVVEEGSTFEIDDAHPSVRHVYDMGPSVKPRAKSKRRVKRSSRRSRNATKRKRRARHLRRASKRARLPSAKRRRAYRARVARSRKYRRRYRVRRGDTLWRIAQKVYGSGRRYRRLYRANRSTLSSPHRIYARQRLFIPRLRWNRRR